MRSKKAVSLAIARGDKGDERARGDRRQFACVRRYNYSSGGGRNDRQVARRAVTAVFLSAAGSLLNLMRILDVDKEVDRRYRSGRRSLEKRATCLV